ncbi:hypothetical protein MRX96_035458 [Rhipicephalus microplus]
MDDQVAAVTGAVYSCRACLKTPAYGVLQTLHEDIYLHDVGEALPKCVAAHVLRCCRLLHAVVRSPSENSSEKGLLLEKVAAAAYAAVYASLTRSRCSNIEKQGGCDGG